MLSATAIVVSLAALVDRFIGAQSPQTKYRTTIQASHTRAKPEPPNSVDHASLEPFRRGGVAPRVATSSPTPAPKVNAPSVATHVQTTQFGDLKDSARRVDTIESVTNFADQLFSTPGTDSFWTTNEQGMDQQDYHLIDGTAVTAWFSQDERGTGMVRAQEAQLPNGEVIDRWFHDNGAVQQIQHQYDESNSVAVYYYENGTDVEAMRIIQSGREIFTRYDRAGRLIEKTIN